MESFSSGASHQLSTTVAAQPLIEVIHGIEHVVIAAINNSGPTGSLMITTAFAIGLLLLIINLIIKK